jgi:hypothetical protein
MLVGRGEDYVTGLSRFCTIPVVTGGSKTHAGQRGRPGKLKNMELKDYLKKIMPKYPLLPRRPAVKKSSTARIHGVT